MLSKEEQKILLKLARETISSCLSGKSLPELPGVEGELGKHCGAFVTLHNNGNLRGCIGHMTAGCAIVETVQEMAVAAATKDSRFSEVSFEELKDIDIEISVLSPMRVIKNIDEIQVGTHGIMMSQGWRRGVLLPQVATEQRWDLDTFLINTCYKAGLPPTAWKDEKTKIEIFTAQVFGERSH